MRLIPTNIKKRPLKALWSVLWPVLVLGYIIWIFSGAISPKSALASNSYFDNVIFYNSGIYNRFSIHITTTFSVELAGTTWGGVACPTLYNNEFTQYFFQHGGYEYGNVWHISKDDAGGECYAGTFTFTAGNTYNLYTGSTYELVGTDYIKRLVHYVWPNYIFDDTEHYYFSEFPSLTITYPNDNDEIAENFYIQGSFTQPAGGDPSGFLQVDTMPAGTYSSSLQSFWQSIHSATSGAVSIWVSGLPASYYDFRIYFRSGDWDFYQGALIQNIHIVNDLPFSLPPTQGEEPTLFPPVYNELICGTYYLENSIYETSTAMFNGLCLTLAPMLLSIGGNLTAYTANFTASNASSTGNQIGQSVVLIRSYLLNLNSFFGNFPVSQFLVLYLLVLILVAIIRLVKGIIHLAKPI